MSDAKWYICGTCRGEGKNSLHLGVVNPDDWSHEEWESYLAGDYDKACADCNGTGKVTKKDIEDAKQRRDDHLLFCAESGINPYY